MSLSHATESTPDVTDTQARAATQTVPLDAPQMLSPDMLAFVAGAGPNGGWNASGPNGGW
jgi:hypothetical protein